MMPHIYVSLRGYPGHWVRSLEGREHLTLTELIQCMDRVFGEVSEADAMIRSMYEIHQMEKMTMEEYMLCIHEAVAVIQRAYPERLTNQDKNFLHDHFYNGLLPSLREDLGFAVADLPEREQTSTTFDTLYTLSRKMEACQSNHNSRGAPPDGYRDRYWWYPTPVNRVATVGKGGNFLPPDPEKQEPGPPGDDPLDGLSTWMTQAMNHFQWEEHHCFICGQTGHFVRECPHKDAFRTWQKQLNFQGVGQHQGGPTPKNPSPHPMKRKSHEEESVTVNAWVAGARNSTSLFVDGPTTNWLGPEAVVKLVVEGCEVNALADSGIQINTVMPEFITQNGWPVLPLEDLVDHPLHLVGLGGNWMQSLGFVILRVQVKEIAGYDKDVIFLIVPDGSDFSK